MVARAVRQVLFDYAKSQKAQKRGGGAEAETLAEDAVAAGLRQDSADEVLSLHQALDRFRTVDERAAEMVELRFFGGLSVKEIAGVLGVSVATANRDWAAARAWLARELS